jgi:hypothetical protein
LKKKLKDGFSILILGQAQIKIRADIVFGGQPVQQVTSVAAPPPPHPNIIFGIFLQFCEPPPKPTAKS